MVTSVLVYISLICSASFPSHKSCYEEPINCSEMCDAHDAVGHVKNMLDDVLKENDDDIVTVSLYSFRGYEPYLPLHCASSRDSPRKITRITFSDFSYDFSKVFNKINRILIYLVRFCVLHLTLCSLQKSCF